MTYDFCKATVICYVEQDLHNYNKFEQHCKKAYRVSTVSKEMTKFFIRYIYTEKERVGITKILNDIKNMNNAGINNNVSTIKGENILKKKKKKLQDKCYTNI